MTKTPEDRLRQLLQEEAEELVPAGDGLRRIEERLAARRSLRARIVPAVAIAGVVAVAGAAALTVALTDKGDLSQHKLPKTHQGTAQPQPSPQDSPTTDPSSSVTTSAPGIPVWPFTTDTEAADWRVDHASRPWADDAVAVTSHLVTDFLKLPPVETRQVSGDATTAVVAVSAAGHPVSQVRLVRVGRAPDGPWSVTGATAPTLTVTSPVDGARLSSPTTVVGTVADPDQSVHVRLMTDSLLTEAFAPAGRDVPWTQPLQWSDTDWGVGLLAANTFNGKGDLLAVTVTAVRRDGGDGNTTPRAGSAFVALDQGHVVTVDAVTGTLLKQVSFPSSGSTDSGPDRGGNEDVVWVRVGPDTCTSSIVRAGIRLGNAGYTLNARPLHLTLPALSYGGRSLAWVEQACAGGDRSVVVRGPDGNESTRASSPAPVTDLDIRDDGTAVVQLSSGVVVLPPGAVDVRSGVALQRTGCTLAAPAWDGDVVVVWEQCGGSWRLDRFTASGSLQARSAVVPDMSTPAHTSVAAGRLLVSLADSRIARLVEGALVDVPDATRWGSADW